MKAEIHDSFDSLLNLRAEWNLLLQRSESNVLFLTGNGSVPGGRPLAMARTCEC